MARGKSARPAAALDKRKLIAELERERRRRVDQRLAELAQLIAAARRARREAVLTVKTQCRVAREKLRSNCHRRLDGAKTKGAETIAQRRARLEAERREERQLRDADRRGIKRSGVRSTAAERRQESDDEVRQNIPDELRGVFERVRTHIHGNARRSRTEAFLQWAEENPGEVYAMQGAQADRELQALIAEQQRAERLQRKARRAPRGAVVLADEFVPFDGQF